MAKSSNIESPLILRFYRLMDVFTKSDEERDFYLNREEGFLLYRDLMADEELLDELDKELEQFPDRYCIVPKLTSYDIKKIMEGFALEKVYDIDNKEKLIDIINGTESRVNFLDFINDNLHEKERWQLYYKEKSRASIIAWLRKESFNFVFEEDLSITSALLRKLKEHQFVDNPPKDVLSARERLREKAKTYYSNEALNPRPKRGRPPKHVDKTESEVCFSLDMYQKVPLKLRKFLYVPDTQADTVTFSSDFDERECIAPQNTSVDKELEEVYSKLHEFKTRKYSSTYLKK